ncbi:MAG: isoleucine--tRNA ligase [Oscillospiraceae bacterium]|nr:isoleucine--tRNA ligase [Oscillospiraceae bacterium]
MSQDYNATINLPQTEFPMRAGLPKREPEMLANWNEAKIYQKLIEKNQGKPLFVLHDGPPFSNGSIHMGTALNKMLKDFVNKYKAMSGYLTPFIPGWDNHGMPIESAIIKQNKLDRKRMSIPEFRDACKVFAEKFVDVQRDQFVRLGVLADWENPYLTMSPEFEAEEVKIFGQMYEKGYIYKGLKPVYWCAHDETALAEAEIEYQDDPCESIYVKFKVKDDLGKFSGVCDLENTYFVIWTTTTWSLPGNLAIALHPRAEYVVAKVANGECYIVAQELLSSTMSAAGITEYEVLTTLKGQDLEYATAWHPFYDRDSLITVAEYVTMESGTGCVHTAPCHGADDYQTGRRYNLPDITPIDDRGIMTEITGQYAGLSYEKATEVIFNDLKESGALLASQKIVHSYPHCWRCKSPILNRATAQWFCSVDAFKDDAVNACESVTWNPAWGKDRISSMIRDRADWCISRQRHWGLPIPVFYCEECQKPVCTTDSINSVSEIFRKEGSNAWYLKEAEELLPNGFVCPHCGGKHFTKETDTLDGWFDSGSSHVAALEYTDKALWPADVYLEGADQYRGWFQSSMLTSVATRGVAPYKTVLTHGWVVDGEGRAMHKSLGNGVAPEEIIKDYGADLLRLWAASSDYHADVRASGNIFKQLSQSYLKIRNTARYILGNLNGFDPNAQVSDAELLEIDRWALSQLNRLIEKVTASYEAYEFHPLVHAIHNFCVVDMSNFYLDVIKDRLYCEEANGVARRSAQTTIYRILDALVRLLAPILSFTAEEIWGFMQHDASADTESVFFNDMPKVNPAYDDAALSAKWERLHTIRDEVNLALEAARNEKIIGKSLEAAVTLGADGELYDFLTSVQNDLPTICIVSAVRIVKDLVGTASANVEGLSIGVEHAGGIKCPRCWMFSEEAGKDAEHPELCPRCLNVVKNIK